MIRGLKLAVPFFLLLAPLMAAEEAAVATPEEKERIKALVKLLGDEDYAVRENACAEMKKIAAKALEELEAASKSHDIEVQRRAGQLLPFAKAWKYEQAWKQAMAETWHAGLKEGRLTGPLLGAASLGKDAPKEHPVVDALGAGELPPVDPEVRPDNSLAWQSLNQAPDGLMDGMNFGAQQACHIEQTALVLLSFLGAGHSEKIGRYRENVQRGVQFLISCQREDGAILNPGWTVVDGVANELAGLALAEASGMGRVPATTAAAQKAVDYSIHKHQCGVEGPDNDKSGFGREPRSKTPDLLTTVFAVMHLKSAKVAGLKIEPAAFNGIIKFLDQLEDREHKTYSLVPGGKTSPQAAIMACLARQFLGWKKEDLAGYVEKAAKEFSGPTTGKDDSDLLINYFGTLAVFQQGGQLWKTWNDKMKVSFIDAQRKDGKGMGSWDPKGQWSGAGRIFATAMNSLCFEVYYRYLPLYKE